MRLYVLDTGEALAVFVPGHRDVSEAKLARALGDVRVSPDARGREGAVPGAITAGFTGPVGLEGVRVMFDTELSGASGRSMRRQQTGLPLLVGAEEGRDFAARPSADVASAVEGDLCPRCEGTLDIARGIEIGHIFKLGIKYSSRSRRTSPTRTALSRPMIMGTYGIGTSRILADRRWSSTTTMRASGGRRLSRRSGADGCDRSRTGRAGRRGR